MTKKERIFSAPCTGFPSRYAVSGSGSDRKLFPENFSAFFSGDPLSDGLPDSIGGPKPTVIVAFHQFIFRTVFHASSYSPCIISK